MNDYQGIVTTAQSTGYQQGRSSLRQLVLTTIGENNKDATPDQQKVFKLFVELMLESFESDELPDELAIKLTEIVADVEA